jgi:predicted GIY-YIG superfamily endonuclease
LRRSLAHHAQPFPDKSSARKREIELKGWRREKNERLFRSRLTATLPSA